MNLETESPELFGSSGQSGNGVSTLPSEGAPDIRGVVDQVTEKHNGTAAPEKRGRGRPRKSPLPSPQMGGSGGDSFRGGAPAPVAAQPAIPTVDPKVIEKTVGCLLRTADEILVQKVARTVAAVTGDKGFASDIATEMSIKKEEVEMISSLSAQVCVQYGWAGQHAPAVLLCVVAGGYVIRVGYTFRKVGEIAAAAQARAAKNNPPNASSTVQPSVVQAAGDGK